jgi:ferredoxin
MCTLCGTCTYVCSPEAIDISKEEDMGYWNYDAGQCTFCGRCVEYCPTKALSFKQNSTPIANSRSQEKTFHIVEYQHCTRCGATILPLAYESLVHLYHSEEAARKAVEVHKLCERCRNRLHGQFLKSGISGSKDNGEVDMEDRIEKLMELTGLSSRKAAKTASGLRIPETIGRNYPTPCGHWNSACQPPPAWNGVTVSLTSYTTLFIVQ